MGLRDIAVRSTYKSGVSDANPIEDFLVPCLAQSVTYDRLSGYFSSRIFALAAEGLADFINGDGRMRLLMSERVTKEDLAVLSAFYDSEKESSAIDFDALLDDASKLKSEITKSHFDAMCWLLKNDRLEVRVVAYSHDDAAGPIFHPKVGIFRDTIGDSISFSGSVNETAAGWTGNIEEFKVFRSWDEGTKDFVKSDQENFEFFWNGGASPNFVTVTLPNAIRQKLIDVAPDDRPILRVGDDGAVGGSDATPSWKFRDYQLAAIEAWEKAGRVGILAMATGTGKTKTAKGALDRARETGSTLIVVSAPFEHIAKQWMDELSAYRPVMASGVANWRAEVSSMVMQVKMGWRTEMCIIGVQNTLATDDFGAYMLEAAEHFENRILVGDEVHGLGATSFQPVMRDEFNMRLGLSATPTRYFDEVGTNKLVAYFGETVFDFPTDAALAWRDPESGARALCDYKYFPHFVHLNEDELVAYEELSTKIAKFNQENLDFEAQKMLESLLFKRAGVAKGAKSKVPALRELLEERESPVEFCLIYCYDTVQLLEVGAMLHELGIPYQKITGEEQTRPDPRYSGLSERDWILKKFSQGITKVLLAIKCLDEGVDVPAAQLAFVLASSGNSREFIQRRGRLLRPSPGKEFAEIFDFLVAPNSDAPTQTNQLLVKEIKRLHELARDALNYGEVKETIAIYETEEM